ncbi:MAG TPA: radical SAM protein [Myxococcota bacterium]|nr:radical SAM protein [Myxococcota bacterium]HRY95088.1 radical SAM protein [Myxococcota bacterium]HSA23048.1 radical SAM protein [Myxococcota bacterium]
MSPERRPSTRPRLLWADDAGQVYDHPQLLAAGWDGQALRPLEARGGMPAPDGLQLAYLPGRCPVGLDPRTGHAVELCEVRLHGRALRPHAVAGVPPPGHVRHLLPAAEAGRGAPPLPLRAYTAVGFHRGGVLCALSRLDPHTHWDPARFRLPDWGARLTRFRTRFPRNRVVAQLARCVTEYGCCTASNLFLGAYEAGLPTAPRCNARCRGCISESDGPVPSPQVRLDAAPPLAHIVEVAVHHLSHARPAMVSFGQGCEGEPLTEAARIVEALRAIRRRTSRGTLHMNTNGSRPEAVEALAQAGLQSVRVSLASARPRAFRAYHRGDFSLAEVEEFATRAAARGLWVAFNLLSLPGHTDRPEELEALVGLLERSGAHMLQVRNLDLDPRPGGPWPPRAGGAPLGMRAFLRALTRRRPGLELGCFNRFREEWPGQFVDRPGGLR